MSFQIAECINIRESVSRYENDGRFNRTGLSSDRGIFHTLNEKPPIILEYALHYSKIDYIPLFVTQISWPVPKRKGNE